MAKKKKTPETQEPQETVKEGKGICEERKKSGPEQGSDSLATLQNELEAAKQEASKNLDLYLRERAELENARKRHVRDREDAIRFANDRLLKEMIPVLDNLERAIEHAEQNDNNNEGLLEGVKMTINQFSKALDSFGVKPINAVGEIFDPNLHQAMGHVESKEQEPNTVINEFQKGYLLHERLLRPSLVMVAKKPEPPSASEPNSETE